jgi:hypothetical protein
METGSWVTGPAASGADRHANSVQLSTHSRCVDTEEGGDGGERVACRVVPGCLNDVAGLHFALVRATHYPELFQARGDRGVVDAQACGDEPQRPACLVFGGRSLDLGAAESALYRSGSGV